MDGIRQAASHKLEFGLVVKFFHYTLPLLQLG
jgi:hypothetical protein